MSGWIWEAKVAWYLRYWRVKEIIVGHNKKGANRKMTVKRPLWEQRNMFGARIIKGQQKSCYE